MKLPHDWQLLTISDIAQVKGGKRLPKGRELVDYDTGHPYIRVSDMHEGGVKTDHIRFVPKDVAPSISRYRIFRGELFITVAGTLGVVGEIPPQLDGANLTENADKLTGIKIDRSFLKTYLQSPFIKKIIDAEQTQNAQPKLAIERINAFPIPIPPRHEQERIAHLITVWDQAVDLTKRLLAEKRLRRKGLAQQLLTGKRHLPGFTEKWREVHLGDIFRNRTEAGRTDLPLVSITGERGVISRGEIDRKDSSSEDKSKYLRICPGDLGYNTMRMWQGVSGLSSLEGIVSPAYTIVTPRKGIDGEFMAIFFKFPAVVHLFYRYSQGLVSDTWNLKFRHFAEIKVTIPGEDEQKAIAKVFSIIDRELDLLQAKAEALRQQRKGLMQQLLTGKKRVKI